MDISYRQADREDIPAIEELFTAMLQSVNSSDEAEGYEAGYLEKFFSGSNDIIYTAVVYGRVIGYISVEAYPDHVYLDDLSVSEEYRGCGVGTRLIELAEKHGTAISAKLSVLHVEKSNEKAYRLYSRLGYNVSAEEGSRYRMAKQLQR
jgi:ribosomal protein S18 acetylase RimI-like enzyme